MAEMGTAKRLTKLAAAYERGDLTRREFCERHGIPVTTLDYYRRRRQQTEPVRFLPVHVEPEHTSAIAGLAVVLANGRRIEFCQSFSSADLLQLLRTLEQA